MIAIHAKWKDGRVVVDEPVDWPEGCELEIRPVAVHRSAEILERGRELVARSRERNKGVPEHEIEREVSEAVDQVRAQAHQ